MSRRQYASIKWHSQLKIVIEICFILGKTKAIIHLKQEIKTKHSKRGKKMFFCLFFSLKS